MRAITVHRLVSALSGPSTEATGSREKQHLAQMWGGVTTFETNYTYPSSEGHTDSF